MPFTYAVFLFFGRYKMKLFNHMEINENNNLAIGGCDAVSLTRNYGTPLYVMNTQLIKDTCQLFKNNFKSEACETEVIYASKAFLTLAMCQLIDQQGLSLDVVSGGELYTAIKAQFPAERIYFHGNNKTLKEILMALNYGVRRIIVDNETELELINYLCAELDRKVDIMIRLNPGIEAHTHEFIKTASNDSKFGISIYDERMGEIINSIQESYYMNLIGFHYHIGSQILNGDSFLKSADIIMEFILKMRKNYGYTAKEINIGGGYGVYYSNGDSDYDLKASLQRIVDKFVTLAKENNLEPPKLLTEPGRSIVANAGTTLYKIGATKHTFGGKKFIFIDGGMTDNPRTALYDSIYEAMIANKPNTDHSIVYTVAGKCCESGDILIKDIELPEAQKGDILAVASTGAYNYSMASNYNRIRKPAVIFVEDGKSKLVVKRESYEDIIRNDLI
jgi:diaminopimelate decarboxylase